MDLSSLPRYPNPEPSHAAPAPRARGCRRTLPLRFLLVLAIWGGLYILREQVTTYSAAREKAREREREWERAAEEKAKAEALAEFMHTTGRWESLHGDGAMLELKVGKFTFTYEGRRLSGRYEKRSDGSYHLLYDLMFRGHFTSWPYRVRGEVLEVEFEAFGEGYFHHKGLPWDGVWRFKRLKD